MPENVKLQNKTKSETKHTKFDMNRIRDKKKE